MDRILQEIRERMYFEGIDLFGTADLRGIIGENLIDTPFAISIGIRMSDVVMDEVQNGPTHTYFHNYRTANALLDRCSFIAAGMLMRKGARALAVPASQSINGMRGLIPHKMAAVHAGLGFIGKSALFVSEKFGPRVRLATVLTDMPVESGKLVESKCGSCTICKNACPAGAIFGVEYKAGMSREDIYDAELCSAHMKKAYQKIGRGAVCGICASVCPFGKK